ncbi:MAG TPA: cell division protein FtsQ/DivIB [Gammaproteobacteria bacterium]|nr:cell division protein FtsQ/DivIB [Gammaproteobacteria bacterium]
MQANTETIRGEQVQSGQDHAPSSAERSLHEIIIALGFTSFLVWAGHTLMSPGTLPIKQVRIEGDFRNLSTQVLQDLIRNEVKGGFFNINVTAIRKALLREPWVSDVSVHRVWPDSLQVYVDEEVAVTRWNDDGLLNNRGRLFRPEKNTIPVDLPRLRGPAQSQAQMLEKYYYLDQQLSLLDMSLAELVLDDRRSWKFVTTAGLTVVIGKDDFDERTERFFRMVPSSLAEKINDAEQVDMRYPNGFAVRWEKRADDQQETGAL